MNRPAEPVNARSIRRLAATLMVAAAGLAIAGFTALGSVFDYPKILKSPTAEILASFREHQGAVTGWFLVLVISAALLAPVGVLLGRLAAGQSIRLSRWIAGFGIAAAIVQVIGLSRWVLFVPAISDDAIVPATRADAYHRFERLHTWLGEVLGETVGYALTATFTVLVVIAVGRTSAPGLNRGLTAPRWLNLIGYAAAALIATGVVIPLGVGAASLTNFAGYVLWCLWLITLAAVLWRVPVTRSSTLSRR